MEQHPGKNKSPPNSQIKVIANWQHTGEASPAFRRLMALLLQSKLETDNKEGSKESLRWYSPLVHGNGASNEDS